MQFPDFDPVLIQLGPIAIRWYGLAYVAGILLGWRYMVGLTRKPALWGGAEPTATSLQIDDLILWITFGVIVGGRLGSAVFYDAHRMVSDPLEVFKIWQGGMSFHGGLAGATLAMIIFARRNGLPVWMLFDVVASVAPIGLFFGRIANFINGELWGRPADVPWAMAFPTGGPFPRHPSQLYEATLEGLVLLVVLLLTTAFYRLLRFGFFTLRII